MEQPPDAAEGMLHEPTFLYSTLKTFLPCLCLSPIPRKSPGAGAVQGSNTEDQKEIKSLLSQSSGCANTHSWTQPRASTAREHGWEGKGGGEPSAKSSFDKQR